MSKKKNKCYVVRSEDNRLAGAFPLTKEGKEKARTWARELGEKRNERYQIFKM